MDTPDHRLMFALLSRELRDDLPFESVFPGVRITRLYRAPEGGSSAAILRYEPGARVPLHRHTGYEHIYVLEGSQRDERGEYGAGTLVVNPPGTEHSVESLGGCVVLAIWERPVAFVEEPDRGGSK